MTLTATIPVPNLNKLDITNVEWVKINEAKIITSEYNVPFGDPGPETETPGTTLDAERAFRGTYNVPGQTPDDPRFWPDEDSNGNMCRVVTIDHKSSKSIPGLSVQGLKQCVLIDTVYPDGQKGLFINYLSYKEHSKSGVSPTGDKKLSHFALAALAAWPTGEARSLYGANWGEDNNGNKFSPIMWERALVKGYLTYSADTSTNTNGRQGTYGTRLRTDKAVEVQIQKRRISKRSVFPFTEKDHWFKIMSGSLQLTHTNMTKVLKNRGDNGYMSSRERETMQASFPVFSSASEFKRARKFFEALSTKKFPDTAKRSVDDVWDPLRGIYNEMSNGLSRYNARQGFTSLFATPYSILKTSMMLNCVPLINENGDMEMYQEVTKPYMDNLKDTKPLVKSLSGVWKCRKESYGAMPSSRGCHLPVLNLLSIDNMTHMYMVLLNELCLISNEAFIRWCNSNSLVYTDFDFEATLATEGKHTIYGYRLTNTLNYSCIVWGDKDK